MKKIALAGLLALGIIAMSEQQASAWINCRFGIGLNWEFQSGGNHCLWGAWHNGQVPGPEAYGYVPAYYYGGPVQQFMPPMPTPVSPQKSSLDAPGPVYAGQYGSPYYFATYPRPVYYYAMPTYYYGR